MYYKKRPRISLNEDQISELTSESTNIYIQVNMTDIYVDRPSASYCGDKCLALDNFCYAEFVRYYYVS